LRRRREPGRHGFSRDAILGLNIFEARANRREAGLRARKESAEVEDGDPPVLFFWFFFFFWTANRHVERKLEARLLTLVSASLLFFALPDLFDDERG
jgi:hypothetical protein